MVNFNVNDDMMPEEKESFALIAEIHVLSDNLTCFQTSNGEAQCPRHKGATEIRINDANCMFTSMTCSYKDTSDIIKYSLLIT